MKRDKACFRQRKPRQCDADRERYRLALTRVHLTDAKCRRRSQSRRCIALYQGQRIDFWLLCSGFLKTFQGVLVDPRFVYRI